MEEFRIEDFQTKIEKIEKEIGKGIIGQKEVVRQVLIAFLAGGNVLLEGVPGLGKTQLVKTISRVFQLDFSRIQFTPDLMPADVMGTNIVVQDMEKGSRFEFKKGPIFANLVLADEINRATPKTQSALLEAMQEHTVTVGGHTYHLKEPFMVLATQNPLEMEGTYPLPEAQLDRFFFKVKVEYPTIEELAAIVNLTMSDQETTIEEVATPEELMEMRALARKVPVAAPVLEYAMKVVMATQGISDVENPLVKRYIRFGASPRAAQALISGARVRALMEGRFNVSFEDIRKIATPVLRHRIFLNYEAVTEDVKGEEIISSILESVK